MSSLNPQSSAEASLNNHLLFVFLDPFNEPLSYLINCGPWHLVLQAFAEKPDKGDEVCVVLWLCEVTLEKNWADVLEPEGAGVSSPGHLVTRDVW